MRKKEFLFYKFLFGLKYNTLFRLYFIEDIVYIDVHI